MIVLRSDEETGSIRRAGEIVASTLDRLKGYARAGIETRELDRIAREEILKRNGYPAFKDYKGFPGNICISVNEVVVHGIPSERRLEFGDIVSIDIGVKFKDYFADAAITLGVGRISPEAERLIETTQKALYAGIANARTGNRLHDVSSAIQNIAESNGFSVVKSFVGHGIGLKLHEEPEIPNFGKQGTGPRLEKGMILAIEPMINAGTFEVEILDDGWTAVTKDRSLSAHFEHTIAIRDGEAEILTKL